jgi:hypothetical protein
MNTPVSPAAGGNAGIIGALERVIGWLDSVPYSLLALPLRFAVATVFWDSGTPSLRTGTRRCSCSRTSTSCRCCPRTSRRMWAPRSS